MALAGLGAMKPLRSRFTLSLAGILSFIAAATLLSTEAAAAPRNVGDVCRVSDPNPPLNVRIAPNGSVIGSLSNGTVITVLSQSENKQWAYVAREDRSLTGWVYSELIDCTAIRVKDQTSASTSESPYSVGALALGGRILFNSNEYRKYDCNPSDQFDGFIWCDYETSDRDKKGRGSYRAKYTILHARDGTAYYINRFQEPAFWDDNEVSDDIARYSRKVGHEPRIIKMPSKPGLPEGIIALWGNVSLEELDNASRIILAADKSVKRGVSVDFIGNYTRSAREGLPLYRLTGGAGFVWIASNKNGQGTLRFLAINPSAFYRDADDPMRAMALDPKESFKQCHYGATADKLVACSMIINGKGFGSRVDLATALDSRCWAYNDLQQYERGLADCNASIALHPKFPYAYSNLGNSLLGLGRANDAIGAYTKSIELKPSLASPFIGRGHAFVALGNKEAARRDFQQALSIEPGNEDANRALAATDTLGTSASNSPPDIAQEPSSGPAVLEQANRRPTTAVAQEPRTPSRWDSVAEFFRFFRFF